MQTLDFLGFEKNSIFLNQKPRNGKGVFRDGHCLAEREYITEMEIILSTFSALGWIIASIMFLGQATASAPNGAFESLDQLIQDLDQKALTVHATGDEWLFLKRDMEAVRQAPTVLPAIVAKAGEAAADNAFSVVLQFQAMLKAAGIKLVLVPVPPKTAMYLDKLVPGASPTEGYAPFAAFYQTLAQRGVQVVDLFSTFQKMRQQGHAPFCRLDTHWSPAAVAQTAQILVSDLQSELGKRSRLQGFQATPRANVPIIGDLASMRTDISFKAETLAIRQIHRAGNPFEPDPNAAVLLTGDSHTLVYSQGLLARHAGLVDQLWEGLAVPVDLVGVLGGGVNSSRIKLARRRDNLAGKKVLIWCFTARDFVRPTQPWKAIPVIR